MTPDLFDPVLDVHLKGAFNVTQPAWAQMREQGYGRIVSTSSAAGIFGNFGQTNYGAAKMGLVGLTRVLAVEGAKYNIKANAIAPLALTRMTEDIMGNLGEKLSPALVSPLVDVPRPRVLRRRPAHLLRRRRAGGRGVHRRGPGFYKEDLTAEDVADNWAAVTDQDGYTVPAKLGEETGLFLAALK